MRILLRFILVLVILLVAWIVVLQPLALGHARDGFKTYIQSIPVSGSKEEIKASYSLLWDFIPLKTEIENLKIQAPRAEWNNKVFFEPVISVDYIRFDPKKLMIQSQPEVIEIGHVDFEGKVHFRTLLQMLIEKNPNFHARSIEQVDGNLIKIVGVLTEVQSEVVLIGELKVNIDGQLEMEIKRVVDFLNQELKDSRKVEKIKNAIDLKWRFNVMDVDLNVDSAAVSELGVYIKSNSSGKNFRVGTEKQSNQEK